MITDKTLFACKHVIPKLILHFRHRVHQDLQAMPPHTAALHVKVKRDVPADEHSLSSAFVDLYQCFMRFSYRLT